mgnify:CR=1 FL=1
MNRPKDEGLNGNEKIEQAVYALQQEATQEQLAHTLTVIRRRMKEHGQFVVAVEPNLGSEQMQLRLAVPEISGIILNPWNRTIQLDKTLIRITKGS